MKTNRPEEHIEKLKISRILPEGRTLACTERGKKVFVHYGAEGDIVNASVTRNVHKEILEGEIREIITPGQGRIIPKCPLHFRPHSSMWCGGCDFQHLSYDAQIKAKLETVKSAFSQSPLGRHIRPEPPLRSPEIWRYRNKIQVPFSREPGNITAGFFHPGTHMVVDFNDCLVQPERPTQIILAIKRIARKERWSIYNEETGSGWLRHVLIRTNRKGEALLTFVGAHSPDGDMEALSEKLAFDFPEIKGVYHNTQRGMTSVILGKTWDKAFGVSTLEERIGKLNFMFYPGSFMQVNTPATEVLYDVVRQFLQTGEKAVNLYDLYCGLGTIGLTMADMYAQVTGVEENQGAIACAWKNAERNKIGNAKFFSGKAETLFMPRNIKRPTAIVLDPPRQGCDKSLLLRMKHNLIRKIVYVSCNPVSFARDAEILAFEGYSIKKIQPVDLFPQTSHIELVALLEKNRR